VISARVDTLGAEISVLTPITKDFHLGSRTLSIQVASPDFNPSCARVFATKARLPPREISRTGADALAVDFSDTASTLAYAQASFATASGYVTLLAPTARSAGAGSLRTRSSSNTLPPAAARSTARASRADHPSGSAAAAGSAATTCRSASAARVNKPNMVHGRVVDL